MTDIFFFFKRVEKYMEKSEIRKSASYIMYGEVTLTYKNV